MKQKAPVHHGEKINLKITGYGHSGTGVGKYRNFTIFVPYAIPAEMVCVQITRVKKTYAHAQLIEVLEASPERVTPTCSVFTRCGGCQLQHVNYSAQLEIKRQQVVDALERIGGFTQPTVHPVIGMVEPWAYRNKAQVPFTVYQGKALAGFYATGSHRVVPFATCHIQSAEGNDIFHTLYKLVVEWGISFYDEHKHQGLLRHVMIRNGTYTGDWMVVLVLNGVRLPREEMFIKQLISRIPQLTSVVLNVNTRRTNVILGSENRLLYGSPVIYDQIDDLTFAISPQSFFQVNSLQTEKLYQQTLRLAALTGEETVIDAYCGAGTISLFLARHAQQVYGVEIVPEAIRDARKNAKFNGISNVEFITGKAEDVMTQWSEQGISPDVIVVDPPRKGCDPALLSAGIAMRPQRWVYVSCNPATFARDVKWLSEQGYELREVQPVDMFPHTGHIEVVALMTRCGANDK